MTEAEREALAQVITKAADDYFGSYFAASPNLTRSLGHVITARLVDTGEFYYLPQHLPGEVR